MKNNHRVSAAPAIHYRQALEMFLAPVMILPFDEDAI